MAKVIGTRFKNAGKLYYFDVGALWPTPGDFLVVETARGMELTEAVTGVQELADEQLSAPLKPVLRLAQPEDLQAQEKNRQREKDAYAVCQQKIEEHKLDMKLVKVAWMLDGNKVLFYFTANGRVDFRGLVKDLASVFKTRIELRQIGARDEAKMLGGLGPCGRPVCCSSFLGDFQPVSIKMAKEQNLSLNQTKISGLCGRLMCCMKYEEEFYEEAHKRLPRVGKEVTTPDGVGTVWDVNVMKELVRVRIQKGDSSELKDYPADQVQRVNAPSRPRKPEQEESEKTAPAGKQASEETARSERNERAERRPQPVMRKAERKPAREEKSAREEQPAKRDAAPAKNPWLRAVDEALKSASGQKTLPMNKLPLTPVAKDEPTIDPMDHEDTLLVAEWENEEDDTI